MEIMYLIEPDKFTLTLTKEVFEEWVNRDAQERETVELSQYLKIAEIVLEDGVIKVDLDLYQEYMN